MKILKYICERIRSLRKDDSGFVLMLTLCIFLFLFVMCASIYAVGETIHQRIRLQNACDAAAYSAAVVQADGLSRMATINRAMSWTYAQMSNRQMDYITYRWLRLTAKRFFEDYHNAKAYHAHIVVTTDFLSKGWVGAVIAAGNILWGYWEGFHCNQGHHLEPKGFWCGQGANKEYKIKLNGHGSDLDLLSYSNIVAVINSMTGLFDGANLNQPNLDTNPSYSDVVTDNDSVTSGYEEELEELDNRAAALDEENTKLEKEIDSLEGDKQNAVSNEERDRIQSEIDAKNNQIAKNKEEISDIEKRYEEIEDEIEQMQFQPGSPTGPSRGAYTYNAEQWQDSRLWGGELGKLIDADKTNIQLMNAMLVAVNENMTASMKDTASFVLMSMLADARKEDKYLFANTKVYMKIPYAQNPYQPEVTVDGTSQLSSFFSPLYNTEPSERLFLQMGCTNEPNVVLHEFFPVKGNEKYAYGLDQWFVRGRMNGESFSEALQNTPSTIRNEGELGIQRVYKDSNLNEVGAGVMLYGSRVDRGNHIVNLGTSGVSRDTVKIGGGGNYIQQIILGFIKNLLTGLADKLCNIQPSCHNKRIEKDASGNDVHLGMCKNSTNTVALYSDYDWSSAKWYCASGNADFVMRYYMCKLLTGKCGGKNIYCDSYPPIKHKRRWIGKIWHEGRGHYHAPKYFCGAEPTDGFFDGIDLGGINEIVPVVPYIFPPGSGEIKGRKHGYMGNTSDVGNFLKPLKPMTGGNHSFTREEYESCACNVDGTMANLDIKTGGSSGIINGHARIYGDDKEIFDERYIGERCEPWVLNRKFFEGEGTIVIGAAVKHRNPFVQIFTFFGDEGYNYTDDSMPEITMFSAFDPVNKSKATFDGKRLSPNWMWTMSAARAGVRRVRRESDKDRPRMYQIYYDASCDAQNLQGAEWHYNSGKWKKGKPDKEPYVMGGCVCSGNEKKFKEMWNLCEQDWDATLLPLRYAGRGVTIDDDKKIRWVPAAGTDATDAGNINPLNPVDATISWQPLDPDAINRTLDNETIRTLLPTGIDKAVPLDLGNLLKQNKVL